MIDLAGICLFIYSLCLTMQNKGTESFWLFFAITLYFLVKHIKIKRALLNSTTIYKTKLNKQKDFFMETITHDFKIPTLAQLRGAELLRKETLGKINNEQEKMIIELENSCKHVLNMISVFTGAYKIEKDKFKLKYETFNLNNMIFSCFNDLYEKSKDKNIIFEYIPQNNNIFIEADKSEIKKVILNLLISALDYSLQNGKITVEISEKNDNIYLSLSGMNLLYTPSLSKENTSKYTTIGQTMGIYLCKKIIELHGGKFYIPCDNKNTIKFYIPRYAAKKRITKQLY